MREMRFCLRRRHKTFDEWQNGSSKRRRLRLRRLPSCNHVDLDAGVASQRRNPNAGPGRSTIAREIAGVGGIECGVVLLEFRQVSANPDHILESEPYS